VPGFWKWKPRSSHGSAFTGLVASLAPLVSPYGLPLAGLMLVLRTSTPAGAQAWAVSISNCTAVSGSPRGHPRRWSAGHPPSPAYGVTKRARRARGNEEAKRQKCDLGRRATDVHFWRIAMDFVLSKHAEVSAEEREILLEWIRQTL